MIDRDYIITLSILLIFAGTFMIGSSFLPQKEVLTKGPYRVHIYIDPVRNYVVPEIGNIYIYENESGNLRKIFTSINSYDLYSYNMFYGNETVFIQYIGGNFYSTPLKKYNLSKYNIDGDIIRLGSIKVYRKSYIRDFRTQDQIQRNDTLTIDIFTALEGRYGGNNYTDYSVIPHRTYYGGVFIILSSRNPIDIDDDSLIYTVFDCGKYNRQWVYILRFEPFYHYFYHKIHIYSEYINVINIYISDSLTMFGNSIILYDNFWFMKAVTVW